MRDTLLDRPDATRPHVVRARDCLQRGPGSGFGSPRMVLAAPDGGWRYLVDTSEYGVAGEHGGGYGFEQVDTR